MQENEQTEFLKSHQFSKNIKKHHTEEFQKNSYTFAPNAANHTFFDSPCIYIHIETLFLLKIAMCSSG